MSGQDRIQLQDESGFVSAISPDMARRQFKISALLIVALAVGTVFVISLGHVQPRYVEPASVKLIVQAPGGLQIQHAVSRPMAQPGG